MVTARTACVAISPRTKQIIQMAKMISPHTRRLHVQSVWEARSLSLVAEAGRGCLVLGVGVSVVRFQWEQRRKGDFSFSSLRASAPPRQIYGSLN